MKVITIGRGSGNDIVIQDERVSRHHLQIIYNDNGVCSVVDLNSANGTFVNGEKISCEVRLQPNDTIRIGHETLPWQEYINNIMLNIDAHSEKASCSITSTSKKRNNILWYILGCIMFLVLLGGGYLYYKSEPKNIDIENIASEDQEKYTNDDLEEKEKNAERLQKEADELFRKALITENKQNKKLAEITKREAEAKQKEADNAKKQITEAIAAVRKANEEATVAQTAAKKAKEEKERAESEKDNATAAMNAANNAKAAAEQDSKNAKESEALTTQFYEMYVELDEKTAKNVCSKLGTDIPNGVKAKTHLKNLFKKSNNNYKISIITQITAAKGAKSVDYNPESDITKQTKEAENTNKTIATEGNE